MAKGNIKLVEMHLDEQALAVVKEYAKAQAKVDALIAVKADAGFNKEFFEEALNDEEIKKTYSRNYNLLYNALTSIAIILGTAKALNNLLIDSVPKLFPFLFPI